MTEHLNNMFENLKLQIRKQRKFINLLLLFELIIIFPFSLFVQDPVFLKLRIFLIWAILFCVVEVILIYKFINKNIFEPKKSDQIIKITIHALCCITIFVVILIRGNFLVARNRVLTTSDPQIQILGKKFIVGVRNFEDARQLVNQQAVAGIYLSKRNFEGHTAEEIKENIDQLQDLQKQKGGDPLIIVADHEGGIVSDLHFGNLVESRPSLGNLLGESQILTDEKRNVVKEYAKSQIKELESLGINTNFSPVVDLNSPFEKSATRITNINARVIGSDPEFVSEVALIYVNEFQNAGINTTLKHFPGIGKFQGETHTENAIAFNITLEELRKEDFVPFVNVAKQSNSMIMLSHVAVAEIDDIPLSISPKAIKFIREDLGLSNKLITDDICMRAVYGDGREITQKVANSMNAGMDFILITYDPDVFYTVMNGLLTHPEKVHVNS